MSGIDERIEESKNWFERLLEKVPGFGGYKKKEIRREADKIERSHLAESLDSCLAKLDEVKLDLMKRGTMEGLADLDVTMRKIRTVRDRIQFADYGYSGAFDATKAGQAQLDALAAFSRSLEAEVAGVGEFATALSAASPSLRTDIGLLADRVEALDARFKEREHLITGAGR